MRMISRSNPTSDLARLHGRLNWLLGDPWREGAMLSESAATFVPALDAFETPESVVVTLELAGVEPEAVEISAKSDELVITGEKPHAAPPAESTWIHAERTAGKFRRVLAIPVAVETEAVTASAKNGLLTITLPKREEIRPKRIEVKLE